MPDQYARPDADTLVGNWEASDGSDLFAMINEAITDNDDWIEVEDDGMGTAEPITFSLSSVTDPASGSGHSVVVRADSEWVSGEVNLNIHLKDGSTSIKSEDFEVLDEPTDHTMSLSTAEANSISSGGYNDLTLILTATDVSSNNLITKVYQAYFRCPEASSSVPIAAIAMNTYRQMGN